MSTFDPNATQEELGANLAELQRSFVYLSNNIDTFFLIINATLIYFMQCGFAFLECGAVRAKNATNILIKNIMDSFMGALSYWIIGWALAFGGGNAFCGELQWAMSGIEDTRLALWFFHFVFAATAATIVSGAVAERCEFIAYVLYSLIITGFVYPIVTHWTWAEEGWLLNGVSFTYDGQNMTTTYMDFAGSGVVHLLGGTISFVAAIMLGPRIGRFSRTGRAMPIVGHSLPLMSLGGLILFFGFFAFNGGSQASLSAEGDAEAIAISVINTIISASTGGLTCLVLRTTIIFKRYNWSLLSCINGGLAGMVAVCAGCNVYYPWGAAIVGAVAAAAYTFWSWFMERMRIDDPLDAVAVHGGAGLWGVIAVPILAKETGLVFTWNKVAGMAIAWNLVGALSIMAWSAALSLLVFGILRLLKILRVKEEIEMKGLDVPKHGEVAYPVTAYGDGWVKVEEVALKSAFNMFTAVGPGMDIDSTPNIGPPIDGMKQKNEVKRVPSHQNFANMMVPDMMDPDKMESIMQNAVQNNTTTTKTPSDLETGETVTKM